MSDPDRGQGPGRKWSQARTGSAGPSVSPLALSVPVPDREPGRPPQPVSTGLWLFAPHRDSLGGSSWLLETPTGDVLVDVPGLTQANLDFLLGRSRPERSGTIVLTGREGHGRLRRLQEQLDWRVLVQEQEAYLLPGVSRLESFGAEHHLGEGVRLLWTPGPSPGACVIHASSPLAGDGLFCGRLLVPQAPGRLAPLRGRRCFHWPRQLASVGKLVSWLPTGSPDWIATGAGLGALRGDKLVLSGASMLTELVRNLGNS